MGTWIRTTGVRLANILNKTKEKLTGPCDGQGVELSHTIWASIDCYMHFGKLAGSTEAELLPAL